MLLNKNLKREEKKKQNVLEKNKNGLTKKEPVKKNSAKTKLFFRNKSEKSKSKSEFKKSKEKLPLRMKSPNAKKN